MRSVFLLIPEAVPCNHSQLRDNTKKYIKSSWMTILACGRCGISHHPSPLKKTLLKIYKFVFQVFNLFVTIHMHEGLMICWGSEAERRLGKMCPMLHVAYTLECQTPYFSIVIQSQKCRNKMQCSVKLVHCPLHNMYNWIPL